MHDISIMLHESPCKYWKTCCMSQICCMQHISSSNPLYIGRVVHCYMLDESICHFRGAESILSLLF